MPASNPSRNSRAELIADDGYGMVARHPKESSFSTIWHIHHCVSSLTRAVGLRGGKKNVESRLYLLNHPSVTDDLFQEAGWRDLWNSAGATS
jgi:hypothetical protein